MENNFRIYRKLLLFYYYVIFKQIIFFTWNTKNCLWNGSIFTIIFSASTQINWKLRDDSPLLPLCAGLYVTSRLHDPPQWSPEREETEKSDCMDAQAQRILAEKWGNDTAGWFLLFAACKCYAPLTLWSINLRQEGTFSFFSSQFWGSSVFSF